jgi:hypothetical protein
MRWEFCQFDSAIIFHKLLIVLCRAANALCDYSCKFNIFLLIEACMSLLYYLCTRHITKNWQLHVGKSNVITCSIHILLIIIEQELYNTEF